MLVSIPSFLLDSRWKAKHTVVFPLWELKSNWASSSPYGSGVGTSECCFRQGLFADLGYWVGLLGSARTSDFALLRQSPTLLPWPIPRDWAELSHFWVYVRKVCKLWGLLVMLWIFRVSYAALRSDWDFTGEFCQTHLDLPWFRLIQAESPKPNRHSAHKSTKGLKKYSIDPKPC